MNNISALGYNIQAIFGQISGLNAKIQNMENQILRLTEQVQVQAQAHSRNSTLPTPQPSMSEEEKNEIKQELGKLSSLVERVDKLDQAIATLVSFQEKALSEAQHHSNVTEPTPIPVIAPSPVPVIAPSPVPVIAPSPVPVIAPSPVPIIAPSPVPVIAPSPVPVIAPSPVPVIAPSPVPTPATLNVQVETTPVISEQQDISKDEPTGDDDIVISMKAPSKAKGGRKKKAP